MMITHREDARFKNCFHQKNGTSNIALRPDLEYQIERAWLNAGSILKKTVENVLLTQFWARI